MKEKEGKKLGGKSPLTSGLLKEGVANLLHHMTLGPIYLD